MEEEHNAFRAMAKALWARGDDGEVVARDLANALVSIIHEGIGEEVSEETLVAEFKRLRGVV